MKQAMRRKAAITLSSLRPERSNGIVHLSTALDPGSRLCRSPGATKFGSVLTPPLCTLVTTFGASMQKITIFFPM